MSFVKRQRRLAAFSMEQLQEMRVAIEKDPASAVGARTPWRFNRSAQRKLDAIAWAITHKLAELRAQRGDPVPSAEGCVR